MTTKLERERLKGPVEILCEEIGARFERRMDQEAILVSFVGVLVDEIAGMRELRDRLSSIEGIQTPAPSSDSAVVLEAAKIMLAAPDTKTKIIAAEEVHNLTHQFNPDEGPCDHLIDMLSSCASAVRFGLEWPCRSRHAAAAADHVWKRLYGISLFDEFTSNWRNDWARAQFQTAILRLTPIGAQRA